MGYVNDDKVKIYNWKTLAAFLDLFLKSSLDLLDKSVFLFIFLQNFFTYINRSEDSSGRYYRENKERLLKKGSWKISKSFQGKKGKKSQYGCTRYQNLSEGKKQKLAEYRKKCNKTRKNISL